MGKMVGVSLVTLYMCSWAKLDKSCVFCFLFERMLVCFPMDGFPHLGILMQQTPAVKTTKKHGCSQKALGLGTDVLSHGRSIRGISLPGHSRPYPTLPKTIQKKCDGSTSMNLVIQAVTFWSPNVGGHVYNLSKRSRVHHPIKVPKNCQEHMFWISTRTCHSCDLGIFQFWMVVSYFFQPDPWESFPFWLIFFRWVETINQL